MWIYRDISEKITENTDVVQILRGPRQCGKSSLILNLDPSFKELSLDDPALREMAQNDPELFLKQFAEGKIFIDEAQYAPALFPSLKRRVDLYKRQNAGNIRTVIRLSGSNQILMDKNVKESLAGRASFFDLNTLSVAEIRRHKNIPVQEILFKGGWPELYANETKDAKKFLDDYINSYVEKDIVLAAGIQKSREFLKFVSLLAGRVGNLLDLASLSREVGVDHKTVKDWTSVLERMHIITLVKPYFSNLSSRLVKSPKVYFLDTGLACRLQGWTSSTPILTSPQQGGLFENLVFAELFKTNLNYQLGWEIFHWRSKDGEELDFVIQKNPMEFIFIEAKVSPQPLKRFEDFRELKKVFNKDHFRMLQCHQEGEQQVGARIPLVKLKEALLVGTGG